MSIALVGVAVLLAIAVAFSENRRAIDLRVVLSAFALQAGIAVLVIYVPFGKLALEAAANGVQAIVNFSDAGTAFLFGDLASGKYGFIVAFKILPVIIFVSSLISVLYYLRIMQLIVQVLGGAIRMVVGVTRVEALCAAANIFVGMIEAPLVVRPYLRSLTRSQFFAILGGGLSSVAGAIMIGYASLGVDLNYLIAAAFMAAPGGLLMSKLILPDERRDHEDRVDPLAVRSFDDSHQPTNLIEAAADGAATGLRIAVNVGAMLIAFVALLALANGALGMVGGWFGAEGLTFEYLLGLAFAPLMFILGVPWEEAASAGNLVGQKLILNEFVAYINFAGIQDTFSEHTQAVVTFALCGFANFSALAIMMGGIGSMVPERKHEIAQMGLKVVLVGTLSNLMSAALASVILSF